MRIALYQPEIHQNTGTIIRTCACFGVPLDIIHPIGFIWDDKRFKRAHMDYDDYADITHHDDIDAFLSTYSQQSIVLLSPQASQSIATTILPKDPIFLFGRESCGFPPHDEQRILKADHNMAVHIPIQQRSLNLAVCVGVVLGHMLVS